MYKEDSLPIPNLPDENLNFSFKEFNQSLTYSKIPPKIEKRFNRSNHSRAQEISFEANQSIILSPIQSTIYDPNKSTYFEQCFQVISILGEGSFSTVYKVLNLEDNKLYAIKESKQCYRSERYRKERIDEAKRYIEFSPHRNCVRLYRTWEENNKLYMLLELCKCSLTEFVVKTKRVPENIVWNILLDILLGLQALHNKDLMHLDIKLENILVGEDFIFKLGDFGLVFDVNSKLKSEAREGDCRYMAAELLEGKFSKAADIFSLGITILELSSNLELPKQGSLWQNLRRGKLPTMDAKLISEKLQYVIKWMMSPNPDDRPSVKQLLEYDELKNVVKRKNQRSISLIVKENINSISLFIYNTLCNCWKKIWTPISVYINSTYMMMYYGLRLKDKKLLLSDGRQFETPKCSNNNTQLLLDHNNHHDLLSDQNYVSDDSDIDFSPIQIMQSSSTPISTRHRSSKLNNRRLDMYDGNCINNRSKRTINLSSTNNYSNNSSFENNSIDLSNTSSCTSNLHQSIINNITQLQRLQNINNNNNNINIENDDNLNENDNDPIIKRKKPFLYNRNIINQSTTTTTTTITTQPIELKSADVSNKEQINNISNNSNSKLHYLYNDSFETNSISRKKIVF